MKRIELYNAINALLAHHEVLIRASVSTLAREDDRRIAAEKRFQDLQAQEEAMIGAILGKPAPEGTITIVVLNDDETFSALEGCKVMHLTPSAIRKLRCGSSPNHLDFNDSNLVVSVVDLKEILT